VFVISFGKQQTKDFKRSHRFWFVIWSKTKSNGLQRSHRYRLFCAKKQADTKHHMITL
jgi:hypothetical protein